MDGKQVPLKEIADIKFVTGPAFIYREGSSRYVGIGFSIRDRDLGSTIDEAQAKVERLNPFTKEYSSTDIPQKRLHMISFSWFSNSTVSMSSVIRKVPQQQRKADYRLGRNTGRRRGASRKKKKLRPERLPPTSACPTPKGSRLPVRTSKTNTC